MRRLEAIEAKQHRAAMGVLATTLADAYGLDPEQLLADAERLAALEATYGREAAEAMIAFEAGICIEDLRQDARAMAAEQGLG
jgi:hypothetical protein